MAIEVGNSEAFVTAIEFADRFFAAAKRLGFGVRLNRNGDRQADFDQKYLTEIDLKRVYRDIIEKNCIYCRKDMERLFGGSRPCAAAPFFEIAAEAGLCEGKKDGWKIVYKFEFIGRTNSELMAKS